MTYSSDGAPAPLTPGGGIPVAPRGRRRDHALAGLVGLLLAPVTILLTGGTGHFASQGRLGLAAFHLLVLLVMVCACQALFAARSSLGGLVAGLMALAGQLALICLADGAATVCPPWLPPVATTGVLLLTSALLTGGAWGMRWARRGGREQARTAMRLTQADRALGVTPSAPPSRRRAHLLTLALSVAALALALVILARGPHAALDGTGQASWGALAAAAGAFLLLAVTGAATGRSSLGARATGIALILISLPALVAPAWPDMPFDSLVDRLLAWAPDAMTLVSAGVLLSGIGWGSHLARRQGHAEELVRARTAGLETSAA